VVIALGAGDVNASVRALKARIEAREGVSSEHDRSPSSIPAPLPYADPTREPKS
jgi:hypothetical protein